MTGMAERVTETTRRSTRPFSAFLYACACVGVLGDIVIDRGVVVIGVVVLVLVVRSDASAE